MLLWSFLVAHRTPAGLRKGVWEEVLGSWEVEYLALANFASVFLASAPSLRAIIIKYVTSSRFPFDTLLNGHDSCEGM
jgi:hypothetical protein